MTSSTRTKEQFLTTGPVPQQRERIPKQSARALERQRAVVGRRVAQRLARLSLPLRRGQGRDPR
ncbi:MAG TPA: hypothetical protein VNW94_12635 [Streptosporangiaceae bacterium]|nr:hypothetical protein [Streptosporangiaceae bacterium]